MCKTDIGEPWEFDTNQVSREPGLLDKYGWAVIHPYDVASNGTETLDRIADYSQAFHDIEDPGAWRKAMIEALDHATTHWFSQGQGVTAEMSGDMESDVRALLIRVNACRETAGLDPLSLPEWCCTDEADSDV